MNARLGRYGALVLSCLGLMLLVGAPSANAACGKIIGAGSSLQNNAQQKVWIPGFTSTKGGWELFEGTSKTGYCFTQGSTSAPEVEYLSTSSGKGLEGWGSASSKTAEEENEGKVFFPSFVGTDVAPEGPSTKSGSQMSNMDGAGGQGFGSKEGVVAVPVAQSAVTVMVSLPVGCAATPTKSENPHIGNETLQKVWYSNEITFSKMIKGVRFSGSKCEVTPMLYARSSPSGTTAGFKRYFGKLSTLEPEKSKWLKDTENAPTSEEYLWPNEQPLSEGEFESSKKVKLEKGSQLAKTVLQNPGSMGYADLSDVLAAGYPSKTEIVERTSALNASSKYDVMFVEVGNNGYEKNGTNGDASPQEGEGVNCSGATYNETLNVSGNEDWSQNTQSNVESGGSLNYPICTLTFDVAWHLYEKVKWPLKSEPLTIESYKESQMESVYGYLKWIVSKEGQSKLESQHFGALPKEIRTHAANGLKEEPGSSKGVIDWK